MSKNILLVTLAILLLTTMTIGTKRVSASTVSNPPTNPYEISVDVPNGYVPMSLDPQFGESDLEKNIWDPVISWAGEPANVFMPMLATQILVGPPDPSSPMYTNFTMYLQIRTGVLFQNRSRTDMPFTFPQYTLTPQDVQFTFQRDMVDDYVFGTAIYLFNALLRCSASNTADPNFGTEIQNSVGSNATYCWLNFANPGLANAAARTSFAPVALFTAGGVMNSTFWTASANLPINYPLNGFFQILGEPFMGIMSKPWVVNWLIPEGIAQGLDLNPSVPGQQVAWNGDFSHWTDYNGWMDDAIDHISTGGGATPGVTCGTGPWILDSYNLLPSGGWSCVKFDQYWGGWPASYPNPPYAPEVSIGIHPAGYATRITERQVSTTVMESDFISGQCDLEMLPDPNLADLHVGGNLQAATLPGIREDTPVYVFGAWCMFPTWYITPTVGNTYGVIYPNGTLNQLGIPANFFSDLYVREAFYQLVNYTSMINDYYLGMAYKLTTFAPLGLAYINPSQPYWQMNVGAAINDFNLAFGGALATTGFTINLYSYNAWGDALMNRLAAEINAVGVSNFGGKFHANAVHVGSGTFFGAYSSGLLPIYATSWGADYNDIADFAQPFMTSSGAYAGPQDYRNATVDQLVDEGLTLPDGPARQALYYELESIYYTQAISDPILVPIKSYYCRQWLNGIYYPNVLPGIFYGYTMWKWNYIPGNVNFDNKVDMGDVVDVLNAFGSFSGKNGVPTIQPRWNFYCDIGGNPLTGWYDRKIDMYDIEVTLSSFAQTQTAWQPPP